MKRAALLGVGAVLALASAGSAALVARRPHVEVASRQAVKPAVASAANKSRPGPVTTHGNIAMREIEAELADAQARASAGPSDPRACLDLSRAVYTRSRVTGDIDEMARAVDLTRGCARLAPKSPDPLVTLAVQEQSLHRFAEARADLARARKLGASEDRVAGIERELDWNAGKWGAAAVAIREEAANAPSTGTVARLARLEHDLGHYDEADALYLRALSLVEDTAPLPVAMIEVQKGMNLTDAGRLADAEQAFRSASERMPRYTAAKEHLAETLHRLGRDEEATALYEQITKASSDPEFFGALAALYRAHGRVADADALRAKATQGYDALLAKYPEAMAWHASEYFAGEGADKVRARSLLQKNVELRPNPEALEALARAEREAGDEARARELERAAATIRASAQPRG